MKTRLLLIAAIFLSFTGCEKIKDAASITVSTNLQVVK
jgi:predicted DNA repair protein MutK